MTDIGAIIFKNDLSTQIALILLIALSLLFIKNKIIMVFTGISKKTATDFDDIVLTSLQKPLTYLIVLLSFTFIIDALNLSYQFFTDFHLSKIIYVLVVFLIAWTLVRILDNYYNSKTFLKNLKDDDDAIVIEQTYEITIRVFKIIIIAIALLMLMQEFGVSISGLLAFGGVGGLVVGLAAKDLLSNFYEEF